MTRNQIQAKFWAGLGLFFHPRLRLLLARHTYGAINKPIYEFSPSLGEKMMNVMTDILTVEDVHRLLQLQAVELKQDMAIYTERINQSKAIDALPISAITPLELTKGLEALLYLFEHQLPDPILPATPLEIAQLRLHEPLVRPT